LRSASLLEFLKSRYDVQVASFTLPHHSKNFVARIWRNGWRFVRGAPPLFDRYSGFEAQLQPFFDRRYHLAVIEHFWCASYVRALRPYCDCVVLDLHNIESELTRTHALATGGLQGIAGKRFAASYARLERSWLPEFDLVLVASEDDRRRVDHPNVYVFPNALPEIARPDVAESNSIVFSGNLEYHPNVEAVKWFRNEVWPRVRIPLPNEPRPKEAVDAAAFHTTSEGRAPVQSRAPEQAVRWRLIGRNPEAVAGIVAGDPQIELIGPVDDAITEIARSKIAIVPLLSGSGTRFKILEAWAAARPVVSTSIGAEGLNARTGEHLLIADNPSDFAAAIARLLEDPELRRRLGEAGRALYLDRFTWPAAWRALDRLL
jgi:glycosyltransferase involved in cell wall biosynthesis